MGTLRILGVVLLSAAAALPITIQNPATPGYVTGDTLFTGVTRITFQRGGSSYMCSGALVSDFLVLTAGHCVAGASNWQVHFQAPGVASSAAVTSSYLHSAYKPRTWNADIPEFDVALLRLGVAAPAAAERYGLQMTLPVPYWTQSLTIVGYGVSGGAGETAQPAGTVRRSAFNTIDTIGSDADQPLWMSVTYGASTPGGEGLINSGDSGGPALYNNKILGVASAGNSPKSGDPIATGTPYSSLHTSLANSATGSWVQSFLVPEPGTYILCGAGLILFVAGRRRRESA